MNELLKLLLEAVVAGAGAYLGSYLKKKGENLATREDINNVVEQVKAVTRATKEIEAKISSDVWDRQKRWELKRDLLFQTTKTIAAVRNALLFLSAACSTQKKEQDPERLKAFQDRINEVNEKCFAAMRDFDESAQLTTLVCGKEVNELLINFTKLTRRMAKEMRENPEVFKMSGKDLREQSDAIAAAIRKEMGVD